MKLTKKQISLIATAIATFIAAVLTALFTSCSVTRTYSVTSTSSEDGEKSSIITTKTEEIYNAQKK